MQPEHTYDVSLEGNFMVITVRANGQEVVFKQVCSHSTTEKSIQKMREHMNSLTEAQILEFLPKENNKVVKVKKEKQVETTTVVESSDELKAKTLDSSLGLLERMNSLVKLYHAGVPLAWLRGAFVHLSPPLVTDEEGSKGIREAKKVAKDSKAEFQDRVAALAFVSLNTDFAQDTKGFLFADLGRLMTTVVNDALRGNKNEVHGAS